MTAKGEELFAKDALSLKALKKMDKSEVQSTLEINLVNLVDYYYGDLHHKEERGYRDQLIDLVTSSKLFLKPLSKIIKYNGDDVPSGLAFMLYDIKQLAYQKLMEQIRSEKESDKPKEEIEANVKALQDYFAGIESEMIVVMAELSKKNFKRLKKLGFKKEFALYLAPAMLDTEYVDSRNMFRFVRLFTNAVYSVVKAATVTDQSGNNLNTLGISLTNEKEMRKFMALVTKGMDLGTLGEFLKQLLLEKRDKSFDSMTQTQLAVYSSITTWVLNTLDDKEVFNNKSRMEIIKSYGVQIQRDIKRGRDAKRRVVFSELDPDMYPKICKAFNALKEK